MLYSESTVSILSECVFGMSEASLWVWSGERGAGEQGIREQGAGIHEKYFIFAIFVIIFGVYKNNVLYLVYYSTHYCGIRGDQ
jgi:hypothetical protein